MMTTSQSCQKLGKRFPSRRNNRCKVSGAGTSKSAIREGQCGWTITMDAVGGEGFEMKLEEWTGHGKVFRLYSICKGKLFEGMT